MATWSCLLHPPDAIHDRSGRSSDECGHSHHQYLHQLLFHIDSCWWMTLSPMALLLYLEAKMLDESRHGKQVQDTSNDIVHGQGFELIAIQPDKAHRLPIVIGERITPMQTETTCQLYTLRWCSQKPISVMCLLTISLFLED